RQEGAPGEARGGPAEQDAEGVLGGDDGALVVGDLGRRLGQGRRATLDGQLRADAALELALEQVERLAEGLGGAARDLQLQLELAELEIRLRDSAHQADHAAAPEVVLCQELCPGALGGAADAAPEVDLPGHVEGAREDVEGAV